MRNRVFVAVTNTGNKAINTRWMITEKVKEGEIVCKEKISGKAVS